VKKIIQTLNGPVGYLLAFGVGVYVIYRVLNTVKKNVTDPVANVIADVYTAIALPGKVTVLGGVKLPNGTVVAISQIKLEDDYTFMWAGKRYRVIGRDPVNSDQYVTEAA
jgi:hypothetical protein